MEQEEREELERYLNEIRAELNLRLAKVKTVEEKIDSIKRKFQELEQTRSWQRGNAGIIADTDRFKRGLLREQQTLEAEKKEYEVEVKLAREREQMVLGQLKQ